MTERTLDPGWLPEVELVKSNCWCTRNIVCNGTLMFEWAGRVMLQELNQECLGVGRQTQFAFHLGNAHVRELCQVISLHDHPQGLLGERNSKNLRLRLRSWDISTRIFFFFLILINVLNLRSAPSDLKAQIFKCTI